MQFLVGGYRDEKEDSLDEMARLCTPKEKSGLGFRDMESFNLALLAKQGLRLINEHDSLLAKLLKARYYQHSNFLDAAIGHNPSYS